MADVALNLSDSDLRNFDGSTMFSDPTSARGQRGSRVVDFGQFRRTLFQQSPRKWELEILPKICRYVSMPARWDSYSAPPVKMEAGMFALKILNDLMGDDTPTPDVVPSSVGGIQLEWHANGVDLEIHIIAPYDWEMWFRDSTHGEPYGLTLTNDLAPLVAPLARLTLR